jgi:hypothetical protein
MKVAAPSRDLRVQVRDSIADGHGHIPRFERALRRPPA